VSAREVDPPVLEERQRQVDVVRDGLEEPFGVVMPV
jgi:hypothetical protein